MELDMEPNQKEAIDTLRQLTLQLMLMAAGVFAVVGGFVAATQKIFVYKWFLILALVFFAASALFGYLTQGAMIEILAKQKKFDPYHKGIRNPGIGQISTFLLGGAFFILFVIKNI